MNESKKRTLFVTVLFFVVLICLFAIFLLQMNMQRTLAQIAAVQATNTQAATPLPTSSVPSEPEIHALYCRRKCNLGCGGKIHCAAFQNREGYRGEKTETAERAVGCEYQYQKNPQP